MSSSEWKEVKLGDIGEIIGGGTPSTKKESYYGGDISWITPKDLANYNERYINKGERMITEEGLSGSSAKLMPKNTVLFSSRAPIGYLAIAGKELCTNQGFKSIVPKDGVSDSMFLYYLLKYKKQEIESVASGTTFMEVSGSTLKKFPVIIPSIEEQTTIAATLSCLDDKIELNNRINKNLEEMAQAIFKSWFVDFEPFQDAEFEDSELGMIPNGWRVESLDQVANYLNGLAMQKFRPESDEYLPVIKIRELNQEFTDLNSDKARVDIPQQYIIKNGDVIFSWSGTLLVKIWAGGNGALNQHLFKVTSDKYDKWFYYFWTLYHLDKFIAIASDRATTMGHIKRSHLSETKVIIPDDINFKKMNDLMRPLLKQIIEIKIQNGILRELRETLIPKLITGEIRVPLEEV